MTSNFLALVLHTEENQQDLAIKQSQRLSFSYKFKFLKK